eukprot:s1426_g25.t1
MGEPDRVAFCAEVLRARGEFWMRERLRAWKQERMRALARNLGLRVKDSTQHKIAYGPAGTAASSGPQTSMQQSSQQRDLDVNAAVEQHARLSACIKIKEKGEEVDVAAVGELVASRPVLLKFVAWLRNETLEVIEKQHRSESQMVTQVVATVRGLLQGYDLVLDGFMKADKDLDELVRGNALQFPAGTHRAHAIVLLACAMFSQEQSTKGLMTETAGLEARLRRARCTKIVDGKESRRRGALDEADKTLLRGFMRRYGWERAKDATAPCYWDELYKNSRSGVRDDVIRMYDELKQWQESSGLKVMPSEADDKSLFGKMEKYRHNEIKKRSRDMARNYPIDFEPLQALSLDCLASAGHGVVMWRSEFEKEMLFGLHGWVEDDRKKQTFHSLQEILRSKDEDALKHLETLRSSSLPLQKKLEKVAVDLRLRCAPTMSSVQEVLARRFLHVPDESAEASLEKYVCRLCDFHCTVVDLAEESGDERRLGTALSWTCGDGQREESACVVCARKFWRHELFPVILFQDPAKEGEAVGAEEADREVKRVGRDQQEKLCHLLGVDGSLQRWPHLREQAREVACIRCHSGHGLQDAAATGRRHAGVYPLRVGWARQGSAEEQRVSASAQGGVRASRAMLADNLALLCHVDLDQAEADALQSCILETEADSYLRQQLLQQGPADAQGQSDDQDTADADTAGATASSARELSSDHAGVAADVTVENTGGSGHLVSCIVGPNDGEDEQCQWIKVGRELEALCDRKGRRRLSVAQQVVEDRHKNSMDGVEQQAGELRGREGGREKQTLKRIGRIQTVAKNAAQAHRQMEAETFQQRPSKLVVMSQKDPASMFESGTWAMAFRQLFPWSDGLPFLNREDGSRGAVSVPVDARGDALQVGFGA